MKDVVKELEDQGFKNKSLKYTSFCSNIIKNLKAMVDTVAIVDLFANKKLKKELLQIDPDSFAEKQEKWATTLAKKRASKKQQSGSNPLEMLAQLEKQKEEEARQARLKPKIIAPREADLESLSDHGEQAA